VCIYFLSGKWEREKGYIFRKLNLKKYLEGVWTSKTQFQKFFWQNPKIIPPVVPEKAGAKKFGCTAHPRSRWADFLIEQRFKEFFTSNQ